MIMPNDFGLASTCQRIEPLATSTRYTVRLLSTPAKLLPSGATARAAI